MGKRAKQLIENQLKGFPFSVEDRRPNSGEVDDAIETFIDYHANNGIDIRDFVPDYAMSVGVDPDYLYDMMVRQRPEIERL